MFPGDYSLLLETHLSHYYTWLTLDTDSGMNSMNFLCNRTFLHKNGYLDQYELNCYIKWVVR